MSNDDANGREPVDPWELLKRKIRETQAAMTTEPIAAAVLMQQQEHAIERARVGIEEQRDPKALQRLVDAVGRSQRVMSNATCRDGRYPPVPAFRLEVGEVMYSVALLGFADKAGPA